MKMSRIKTNKLNKRRDDNAAVIAELFNLTQDYVRKVVADTKHQRYKGDKPKEIRKAYLKYKYSKEKIINQLKQKFQQAA